MALAQDLRWRRARRSLTQGTIVLAALGLVVVLGLAIQASLAARGIAFSFDFLSLSAGFQISEGLAPTADGFQRVDAAMTNAQVLMAGLWNTLKVALVAIIASTVLGTLLGVGKLSTNFLINRLSFLVIEFLRNTPLLIQLTFWYVGVVLQLPGLRDAPQVLGAIFSRQGAWLPRPMLALAGHEAGAVLLVLAIGAAALAWRGRRSLRRLALVAAALLLVLAAVMGLPLAWDVPQAGRFRASGGITISPEYTALVLAITVNSAAYLGEIVRGAIEAMPRGQWEAAQSVGMSRQQTLRDIILPQVFRVVLPSFGNQYISLTKNTSLGIAVGYPDLFNVYGTVSNQTGRSLEGVLIVMLIYLLLGWLVSAAVNMANRRINRSGVGQ